jgi:hypothetical protein
MKHMGSIIHGPTIPNIQITNNLIAYVVRILSHSLPDYEYILFSPVSGRLRLHHELKIHPHNNDMSVHFADSGSKPSMSDLASFASRANEIEVDDVIDLGDDLGFNMLANQNKILGSPKPPTRSLQFSSGGESRSEIPQIQIRPVDDLEVVNLDSAPGISDIGITMASGNNDSHFVINGAGNGGIMESADASVVRMSKDEEIRKKKDLLTKLKRLENDGVRGSMMSMQNSLDEIQDEYDSRTDSRGLEASLRFQRNLLMTFVTGVEFASDRYGSKLPMKPRLKGWSESVHTNVEDFDEMFEELYDMYKHKEKMHPMARIAGTLGVSAVMYHITNTSAERSGIPGMTDVLNENPELQRQFAAAMAAKMGGGMGNFMTAAGIGGTMGGISSPYEPPAPPSPPRQQSARVPFNMAASAATIDPIPRARREMSGPSNVDDILKAFETERMVEAAAGNPIQGLNANIFTPSGPPPTPPRGVSILREGVGSSSDPLSDFLNTDDYGSVGSGSTMNTARRRGRKSTATIPAGATMNLNI